MGDKPYCIGKNHGTYIFQIQTAAANIPVLLGNGRRREVLLELLKGDWPGTTVR